MIEQSCKCNTKRHLSISDDVSTRPVQIPCELCEWLWKSKSGLSVFAIDSTDVSSRTRGWSWRIFITLRGFYISLFISFFLSFFSYLGSTVRHSSQMQAVATTIFLACSIDTENLVSFMQTFIMQILLSPLVLEHPRILHNLNGIHWVIKLMEMLLLEDTKCLKN